MYRAKEEIAPIRIPDIGLSIIKTVKHQSLTPIIKKKKNCLKKYILEYVGRIHFHNYQLFYNSIYLKLPYQKIQIIPKNYVSK